MPSFPKSRIVESIREICKKEYNVENVHVKIEGKTIGVYLPLEKLFTTDLESILSAGKLSDISSLLKLSPEALEKVEDVLFSTSRVILSTDQDLDFYVLQATDTALTGITLVLVGYIMDIKRVRFWDIPRSEYRKRVYHDLNVNYVVIWKQPVESIFEDMGKKSGEEILDTYFLPGTQLQTVSPVFYAEVLESQSKENLSYEIVDLRATSNRANEAVVYVKVRQSYTPKPGYELSEFSLKSDTEAEYIFTLTKYLGDYKVSRVLPFHYIGADGNVHDIDFLPELEVYQNLNDWSEEFELDEIFLPDFLAQQLTRRVQGVLIQDERIQNAFEKNQVTFRHFADEGPQAEEGNAGYFTAQTDLILKNDDGSASYDVMQNEDVLYLLDQVVLESSKILSGYWFKNYQYLELSSVFGEAFALAPENLDLYRRKKIDVTELLTRSGIVY